MGDGFNSQRSPICQKRHFVAILDGNFSGRKLGEISHGIRSDESGLHLGTAVFPEKLVWLDERLDLGTNLSVRSKGRWKFQKRCSA
jgi:hypothetical protein